MQLAFSTPYMFPSCPLRITNSRVSPSVRARPTLYICMDVLDPAVVNFIVDVPAFAKIHKSPPPGKSILRPRSDSINVLSVRSMGLEKIMPIF
ncbi:hypothetical protein [Gallid alphaherpesvirus 2]|uniref:Uncharacterized protein n=1 Tax=Gallid alphaherpesvirus 2 TaxID=10390 RepID=A7KQ62_9ALPH|nr:hypothetical protein MDV071.4 [Gallid alphaherpesvirus 2]ACF49556.1 hypothetical protein MDV071.4 [synthetic construct]AFM74636.1 hypothetical protein [Gallid alphaherpesvirus 2]AFM74824.1 hypothetical protein [Gallid alphaherpesvirus 2]AFM75014.1 hypothetical protein [Gallid alphaherpesvirus 2]